MVRKNHSMDIVFSLITISPSTLLISEISYTVLSLSKNSILNSKGGLVAKLANRRFTCLISPDLRIINVESFFSGSWENAKLTNSNSGMTELSIPKYTFTTYIIPSRPSPRHFPSWNRQLEFFVIRSFMGKQPIVQFLIGVSLRPRIMISVGI